MKKTLLIIVVFLVCSFSIFAMGKSESNSDDSLQKVKDNHHFVLGLDDSFPPMGFRDENNEIVGFDIDVAKEVCKGLGVDLVCQPIDWNAKEQELATGNIDCIWNGFTVTEKRKERILFSMPYLQNAQVVVVKNKDYKTKEDLYGKTVGLQAGSTASNAVDEEKDFKDNITLIEFKDNLTALMDLSVGGVDAVVMDLLVANEAIKKSNANLVILADGLSKEDYAIGFRLNDVALKEAVDSQLIRMKNDGTLAAISQKWFNADITTVSGD